MTADNSKHRLSKKTVQKSQQFGLLVEFIDAAFGVCTIFSHVTTKSWVKLYLHVQMLKYSPILQSLLHT